MAMVQRVALKQAHARNMEQLRSMRAGSVLGAKVSGKDVELPTNPGRIGRATLDMENSLIRSAMRVAPKDPAPLGDQFR